MYFRMRNSGLTKLTFYTKVDNSRIQTNMIKLH